MKNLVVGAAMLVGSLSCGESNEVPAKGATERHSPMVQPAKKAPPNKSLSERTREVRRLYLAGEHKKAITLAEVIIALDSEQTTAWRLLGASACYLKDEERLREVYPRLDKANQDLLRTICNRKGISLPIPTTAERQEPLAPEFIQDMTEYVGEIVQRCADLHKTSGKVRVRAQFSEYTPGRAQVFGDQFAVEVGDCIRDFVKNSRIGNTDHTMTIDHSWNVRTTGVEDMTWSPKFHRMKWAAPLTRAQVEAAMQRAKPTVQRCREGLFFPSKVKLTIHPDGHVIGIEPSNDLTEKTDCVWSALSQIRFPRFSGTPFSIIYTYHMAPRLRRSKP